ncbi:electron transfer flavoprotein subunit beta [Companilactobacillus farciminis]|nr:electron transfer flavoprotein subunit beta [Companilactobacillus farciminis]
MFVQFLNLKKVAKKNHRLSDDPVTAARELVDILKQKNILTEDK